MSPEERVAKLGLEIPPVFAPAGNYVALQRVGKVGYLSGLGPMNGPEDVRVQGKAGGSLSIDEARFAAQLTGLNMLSVLRSELGSLNHVHRIIKILGFVNCAPGFNCTPEVVDGCSDLLAAIWGNHGGHARSAVGVAELPFDIVVEVEAVVELT